MTTIVEEKTSKEDKKSINVEKKRNLILFDNIWRTLLLISLPVALTSMITEIFALFDTYFASKIDSSSLAAMVFVSPVSQVILAISGGLAVAATALIAKALATKDYEKARRTHFQMILITIVVSALVVAICFVFASPILKFAGATSDLLDIGVVYFRLIVISLPFRFFNDIFTGQQRAIGNNRRIMVLNLMSVFLKFSLSYLFIVELKYGIAGLGWSTIISSLFVSICAFVINFIKKDELKIGRKDVTVDFTLMWVLLAFAAPIIIEKSTQSFGNAMINSFATGLGDGVLSAYGVINRINSVVFSFSGGFGAALVAIVSQNITVGNKKRIKDAKNKGLILSLAIVGASLVIVFALRGWIATMFSTDSDGVFDQNLYDNIIHGMNVYTISALPWTVMQIYFGIFQGLKKPHYVFVVSLVRLWVFRVLLVFLLINVFNWGANAIWYGMLISNILAMLTAMGIYFFFIRKDIEKDDSNNNSKTILTDESHEDKTIEENSKKESLQTTEENLKVV